MDLLNRKTKQQPTNEQIGSIGNEVVINGIGIVSTNPLGDINGNHDTPVNLAPIDANNNSARFNNSPNDTSNGAILPHHLLGETNNLGIDENRNGNFDSNSAHGTVEVATVQNDDTTDATVIPEAFLVQDPELIHAELAPPPKIDPPWYKKKPILLMLVFAVIALVAIVVSVTRSNGGGVVEISTPTASPSFKPTFLPTTSPFTSPSATPSLSMQPSASPSTCVEGLRFQELNTSLSPPKSSFSRGMNVAVSKTSSLIASLNHDEFAFFTRDGAAPAVEGRKWEQFLLESVMNADHISVALSGKGDVAVIGIDTGDLGEVHLWEQRLENNNVSSEETSSPQTRWERTLFFQERGCERSAGSFVDLNEQGNVFVVGYPGDFDGGGSVSVYRKRFGNWRDDGVLSQKLSSSSLSDEEMPSSTFGASVAIDGNMIAVGSPDHSLSSVYVYYYEEYYERWVDLDDSIGSWGANFSPMRSPDLNEKESEFFGAAVSMSQGILVIGAPIKWPSPDDVLGVGAVYLYELSDDGYRFVYRQKITPDLSPKIDPAIADWGWDYGSSLSIDGDTLVVGCPNDDKSGRVYVYSKRQQNKWEEVFVLKNPNPSEDIRFGSDVDISGRTLLVGSANTVYSYNLDDCVQPQPTNIPTQLSLNDLRDTSFSFSPSFSLLPSVFPTWSILPTSSELPSLTPSMSISPSYSAGPSVSPSLSHYPSVSNAPSDTCYWVEIGILFDQRADETSWEISHIVGDDDDEEMDVTVARSPHYNASLGQSSVSEYVCLQEEKNYTFTIRDAQGDGICCEFGKGSFVLSVGGEIISTGGNFKLEESVSFDIPYDPSPIWIEEGMILETPIPIDMDTLALDLLLEFTTGVHGVEASWELLFNSTSVDSSNEYVNIASGGPYASNHRYRELFFLPSGDYQLKMYDWNGNGIKNFSLTTFGLEFERGTESEDIRFKLPPEFKSMVLRNGVP